MTTQHRPHFVVSSARGALLRCSCNWELTLPKVEVSPLHTAPIQLFFRAGFDVGREFENHVMEDTGKVETKLGCYGCIHEGNTTTIRHVCPFH